MSHYNEVLVHETGARVICVFLFVFLSYVLVRVMVGRERERIRRRKGGKNNLAIPRLYGETAHTIHIACQYFWSAARTLVWSPSILPQRRNVCARVT